MGYEIKLDNNCKIFYEIRSNIHLRSYNFEYISFNGIRHEQICDIYLVYIDEKNKFRVSCFMNNDLYFDTFNDAEVYIFNHFSELRNRLIEEEKEIKSFIARKNRRKNVKN